MTAGRKTPDEQQRAYVSARLVAVRAWAFVGCAVAFVIALVALGSVGDAVKCLLVGAVVGFICSSLTNWLERHGVGRGLGALVSLVAFLAIVAGFLCWLGPMFLDQLRQLLERMPAFFSQLQDAARNFTLPFTQGKNSVLWDSVQGAIGTLGDVGKALVTRLANWLSAALVPNMMALANDFVMFFLGLVLAYWFAKDYPAIMRELGVIAGPRHDEDLALLVAVLGRSVGGYMRGIVITSVLNGALVFLALWICGHPYAGLMGVVVGIMHFVPVVGPAVSALLATLTGLFASPAVAVWTLVWAIVAQNVTDNLVSPLVMQSAVKIHPAMSLIGITVGASLGGAVGMALAVPLTAAVKGAFIYYFESKTGRQLVGFDGALFKGTPFHHADGSPVPSYDALDDDSLAATSLIVANRNADDVQADEAPAPEPGLLDHLRARLHKGE